MKEAMLETNYTRNQPPGDRIAANQKQKTKINTLNLVKHLSRRNI